MALLHKPVYGFVNDSVDDIIETIKTLKLSDEDDNDQYAPEDSPEDDNLGEMEPLEDGPDGGEEEAGEDLKPDYLDMDGDGDKEESMKKAIEDKEKEKEEEEQIALSPQEIARQMQQQRQNEMQNFYRQERLNRYGY